MVSTILNRTRLWDDSELILNLHQATGDRFPAVEASLNRPVAALVDPRWLYQSEAMSPLYPRDYDNYGQIERFGENYFRQYREIMEQWGDYGFIEYGARPHVWYRKVDSPEHPLAGRWYPYLFRYSGLIDYGFSGHLWRMYARSGDRGYLDLAEETNRQRMDICMVHWDSPNNNYANAHSYLIGKYKGSFSGSSETIPWSGRNILHNHSGSELRHLYWYYYLRDYRRAHDVAEEYRQLVKQLWTGGSSAPFVGTRPFATLKNLGTLYQETGDEVVLAIGRNTLETFADPETAQGVSTNMGPSKLTTKIGGIERWYEATGDELAERSLLKLAEVFARNSMGNPAYSYYNIYARILNRAYRITGDPLYARILKRNMELAIESFYDFEKDSWGRIYKSLQMVSAADSAYPMGDFALGLDAVSRAGDLGPVPLVQQREQGRPVVAIFRKDPGRAVVLDVRGREPISPKVLSLDGLPVESARVNPFVEHHLKIEKVEEPNSFWVELPANVAAGEYILDAGVGGAPWEVTWSDAPGLVLYAPGGVSAAGGPSSYFKVPADAEDFEFYSRGAVALYRPDGGKVSVTNDSWSTVAVPPSERGRFWKFTSHTEGNYVELRGVPAWLVCDTNRCFEPNMENFPYTRLAMQPSYAIVESTETEEGEGVFVAGRRAGGSALALHGRRALEMVAEDGKPLLNTRSGTFEMWFKPNWSSVYGAKQNYVLLGKSWLVELNYLGSCDSLMRLHTNGGGRFDLRNPLTLEQGQWHHLVWQWQTDVDNQMFLEMYADGIRRGWAKFSHPDKNGKNETDNLSKLTIGHHHNRSTAWGSLDGVVSEMRLSSRPRYGADFELSEALIADGDTLAFFTFEDILEGQRGDGGSVKARLLE